MHRPIVCGFLVALAWLSVAGGVALIVAGAMLLNTTVGVPLLIYGAAGAAGSVILFALARVVALLAELSTKLDRLSVRPAEPATSAPVPAKVAAEVRAPL